MSFFKYSFTFLSGYFIGSGKLENVVIPTNNWLKLEKRSVRDGADDKIIDFEVGNKKILKITKDWEIHLFPKAD